MTKKTVQPKAEEKNVVAAKQREAVSEKAPSGVIVTTDGKHRLDTIRVDQRKHAEVTAMYGKVKEIPKETIEKIKAEPDKGKKKQMWEAARAESRKDMKSLPTRIFTPEQSKHYQELAAKDPVAARLFAVQTVYPMHYDDKAFRAVPAEVNGRPVDYLNISKNENGKWEMSFGMKGNKESRTFATLNAQELASYRHRAVVTLDKETGKVASVGAPLSIGGLAAMVDERLAKQREAKEAKLDAAQKVDWSKYKVPEGVSVSGLRWSDSKEPGRAWLNGKVNGIEVHGLLSANETTALKNGFATFEQVLMANSTTSKMVGRIVDPMAEENTKAAAPAQEAKEEVSHGMSR